MTIDNQAGSPVALMNTAGREVVEVKGLQGSSPVRRSVRPRPTGHGTIDETRYTDEQLIEIVGDVFGGTPEAAYAELRAITSPLVATLDGQPAMLKWTEGASGLQLQRLVKLASGISPTLKEAQALLRYQAILAASDPRAYRQTETTVVGAAATTSASMVNRVLNPSFEINTTGWSTSGTHLSGAATLTRAHDSELPGGLTAPSGQYVGSFTHTTSPAGQGIVTSTITLAAGTYRADVWVAGPLGYQVQLAAGPSGSPIVAAHTFDQFPEFRRLSVAFTLGSSSIVSLAVRSALTGSTGPVYVDAAKITPSAPADAPYFDGDSPGCRWQGTVHNSLSSTGDAAGGLVNVTNAGERETPAILRIGGAATWGVFNPAVFSPDGCIVSLRGQLSSEAATGWIEIDVRTRTVDLVRPGQRISLRHMIDSANSRWTDLPTGTTQLRLASAHSSQNPRLTVIHRDAY
ncbi:MAG: hypothetical protein Q8O56_12830 [Solirubrobacteraceae bacterium]|nr:hypothetical protein [Solirubrobacteraceae bacterium]